MTTRDSEWAADRRRARNALAFAALVVVALALAPTVEAAEPETTTIAGTAEKATVNFVGKVCIGHTWCERAAPLVGMSAATVGCVAIVGGAAAVTGGIGLAALPICGTGLAIGTAVGAGASMLNNGAAACLPFMEGGSGGRFYDECVTAGWGGTKNLVTDAKTGDIGLDSVGGAVLDVGLAAIPIAGAKPFLAAEATPALLKQGGLSQTGKAVAAADAAYAKKGFWGKSWDNTKDVFGFGGRRSASTGALAERGDQMIRASYGDDMARAFTGKGAPALSKAEQAAVDRALKSTAPLTKAEQQAVQSAAKKSFGPKAGPKVAEALQKNAGASYMRQTDDVAKVLGKPKGVLPKAKYATGKGVRYVGTKAATPVGKFARFGETAYSGATSRAAAIAAGHAGTDQTLGNPPVTDPPKMPCPGCPAPPPDPDTVGGPDECGSNGRLCTGDTEEGLVKVNIASPAHGSRFARGEGIRLVATVEATKGISRVTTWINGVQHHGMSLRLVEKQPTVTVQDTLNEAGETVLPGGKYLLVVKADDSVTTAEAYVYFEVMDAQGNVPDEWPGRDGACTTDVNQNGRPDCVDRSQQRVLPGAGKPNLVAVLLGLLILISVVGYGAWRLYEG